MIAVAAGGAFTMLALVVASEVAWVQHIDTRIHDQLRGYGLEHPWWLATMRALTHLGDGITVTIVDTTAFVVCLLRHRWQAAAFVASAGLGVWLASRFPGRSSPGTGPRTRCGPPTVTPFPAATQ